MLVHSRLICSLCSLLLVVLIKIPTHKVRLYLKHNHRISQGDMLCRLLTEDLLSAIFGLVHSNLSSFQKVSLKAENYAALFRARCMEDKTPIVRVQVTDLRYHPI